jgi:uncharacterized sporulation protein YeaH/YhbH (DUF444 family)
MKDIKFNIAPNGLFQEDKINSNESEGAFNEFIDDRLKDMVENIINDGDLSSFGDRESDIIVETDDISPPRFSYGDDGGGGAGGRGQDGPGDGSERIRFSLPFDRLMELIAEKLRLPNLLKEGQGKIKEVSYEFKTFGTAGVILDKKRTFKRALKSNIATGGYKPDEGDYDILIRRRDRRYKLPERVEKPKYKAVVFYMGDISYSTYGERLELEKKMVGFIHNWLNYNYGADNVEHRFFVHDSEAHEVSEGNFFKVKNAGGTKASIVFDLVSQVAFNEYDPDTTNFYGFYFGDGELFSNDADDIADILNKDMFPIFNRIGIVEVKPSSISNLVEKLRERYADDKVIRLDRVESKKEIIKAIKNLFGEKQYA